LRKPAFWALIVLVLPGVAHGLSGNISVGAAGEAVFLEDVGLGVEAFAEWPLVQPFRLKAGISYLNGLNSFTGEPGMLCSLGGGMELLWYLTKNADMWNSYFLAAALNYYYVWYPSATGKTGGRVVLPLSFGGKYRLSSRSKGIILKAATSLLLIPAVPGVSWSGSVPLHLGLGCSVAIGWEF
jgi:hypothetical protein